MSLASGTRLGAYEVIGLIGRGGMGEVYRAHDTKLDRDVALKVLPDRFANDPDRLVRFQREAKVLASLNHPNIAQIHGLEESGDTQALVLEYVEGPTLTDRIAQSRIPVDEALPIAKQIAEALEAAHGAGVIHRDLKPANVKVKPDGMVKVLDFGLAKALDPAARGATPSQMAESPTMTMAATANGVILGTAGYMSPEQARGRVADKQADIWAFGCVLFEMLTGRRAFAGATVSDTLAAVLRAEPDWQRLPSNLHPRLRLLLERCLEKNPKDRYHAIADARVDIERALADPESRSVPAAAESASVAPYRRVPWVAATAVLTAIVVGASVWSLKPPAPQLDGRLTHVHPDGQSFIRGVGVAVAPDGSSIVYVANNELFLRLMNELGARPIRGTEGAPTSPFFSPDGQSVGYWDARDGALKKIEIAGGTPIALDSATNFRGASWEADGTILYGKDDGIWTVSADGGQPELVIPIEQGWANGPQMLPDGRTVLFTLLDDFRVAGGWEGRAEIVVQDLETGTREVLLAGEDGRYVPTGHLVYAVDTTLFAVPFDAAGRQVTGGPVPVVEGVRREVLVPGITTATANYDFTHDGRLVYVHGPEERFTNIPRDLVAVDREGVARPLTDERRDYWRPRISPDGTHVAVEVFDGAARHIWVIDVETGVSTQLTFERALHDFPVWTPDGQSVIFHSRREEADGIYRKPADGSGEAEFLGVAGATVPTDASRDGILVFSLGGQTGERAIWTLPLVEGESATEFLATPAMEHHAMFSPDGNWIAYGSNASGQHELYVRPYPMVEGTERRVSEGGGAGPVWSPDGSELYYRGSGSIMVASTPLGPGFVPGRPRPLFPMERFRFSGNASAFDIHPDGDQFIMVTVGDPPPPFPSQINVVLNWFEELKARVPSN